MWHLGLSKDHPRQRHRLVPPGQLIQLRLEQVVLHTVLLHSPAVEFWPRHQTASGCCSWNPGRPAMSAGQHVKLAEELCLWQSQPWWLHSVRPDGQESSPSFQKFQSDHFHNENDWSRCHRRALSNHMPTADLWIDAVFVHQWSFSHSQNLAPQNQGLRPKGSHGQQILWTLAARSATPKGAIVPALTYVQHQLQQNQRTALEPGQHPSRCSAQRSWQLKMLHLCHYAAVGTHETSVPACRTCDNESFSSFLQSQPEKLSWSLSLARSFWHVGVWLAPDVSLSRSQQEPRLRPFHQKLHRPAVVDPAGALSKTSQCQWTRQQRWAQFHPVLDR